jgi:hypothetical protein
MRENGLIIADKSTYFITEKKGKDAIHPRRSQGGSFANCLTYLCLIRFLCYRNQMKNCRLRLWLPQNERLSRAKRAAARIPCREGMGKARPAGSARRCRLFLRWAPCFNRRSSR